MRVASILPEHGSHNFPTWVQEMPPALKWMNQQLTFPQDVVPRHHKKGTVVADPPKTDGTPPKSGGTPLQAEGPEPTPTARTRR
jgi:hypothetical protein